MEFHTVDVKAGTVVGMYKLKSAALADIQVLGGLYS
jgi:hypothetical protein